MRSYRVFGDSHCGFLGGGLNILKNASTPLPIPIAGVNMLGAAHHFYQPFHQRTAAGEIALTLPIFDGRTNGLCDERKRLIKPAEHHYLISLGLHTQTVLAGQLFKTHSLARTTPQPQRAFLSEAALKAIYLNYHQHVLRFIGDLMEVGADVTIISAPPRTRRYAMLENGFSISDMTHTDNVMRGAMKDSFREMGLIVVEPPQECMDSDGYLLPEYLVPNERDRHHATSAYSAIMLLKSCNEVAARLE